MIYLVSHDINKNCELSCDEAVIRKLDNKSKRSYGDTISGSTIHDKNGNPLELYWDAWNVDSNGNWGNSGDFAVTGVETNSPKSYN